MSDEFGVLRLLESQDFVRKHCDDRHERSVKDAKVKEICNNFAQGREFLAASRTASLLTLPLLQYYSISACARGLCLMLNPDLRETSLPESHGLTTVGWPAGVSSGKPYDPLELKMKSTSGLFSLFCDLTNCTDFVRTTTHNLRHTNLFATRRLESLPKSFEIALRDVLFVLPELARTVYQVTGDQPRCRHASLIWTPDQPHIHIEVIGDAIHDQSMMEIFGVPKEEIRVEGSFLLQGNPTATKWTLKAPTVADLEVSTPKFFSHLEEATIVSPTANPLRLSKAACVFAASFALGMLVRYRPSIWFQLASRSKGDAAFPILNRFLETVPEMYFREVKLLAAIFD